MMSVNQGCVRENALKKMEIFVKKFRDFFNWHKLFMIHGKNAPKTKI